jgi:hypothetical protein
MRYLHGHRARSASGRLWWPLFAALGVACGGSRPNDSDGGVDANDDRTIDASRLMDALGDTGVGKRNDAQTSDARNTDAPAADGAPADVAPADGAPADVAPADVAPADVAPADVADPDGGRPADGGEDSAATDSGGCNGLTVTALVSFGCIPFQSPPAATGGSLTNGVYVLTSGTLYDPTGSCTGIPVPTAETIDIESGTMQKAENVSGWLFPQASTWTVSVGGTWMSTTETCPSAGEESLQYSATATTLTTIQDGFVAVYTHE